MSWLILINNQNENHRIWNTSYSGTTEHKLSLSVRHRGRCFPCTRMTNINIAYKYSDASHASLITWFLFHTSQRKLIERKNRSQIHSLNVSSGSLSLKASCETSRSQISLFPLSPLPSPPHHLQSCSENREISSEMVPLSQKSHYSGMIPSAAAQVLFF